MADTIEFFFREAKPFDFFVTDLKRRAFRVEGGIGKDGKISIETERGPFALYVLMVVPAFGQIWVTADNEGEGYHASGQSLLLAEELARSRMAFVRRRNDTLGEPPKPSVLEEAETILSSAQRKGSGEKEKLFLEALSRLIVSLEETEIAAARKALAKEQWSKREPPRISATLFGERLGPWAIGVGPDWPPDEEPPDFSRTPEQRELLASLFNGTTIPSFWRWVEPKRGKPRWDALDEYLRFAEDHGIESMSFALLWANEAGGTPPWFRELPFKDKLNALEKWITQMVRRYRERISVWETVNEIHDSMGNAFGWKHKEIVDLVRVVNELVGALDPGKPRILNHNMPLGEYIQREEWRWSAEPPEKRWTPLTFLDELLEEGVPFDGVGLQMYVPKLDLAECFRWIDEFARLAKPICITELAYPSKYQKTPGIKPGEVDPASLRDAWRKPWSEATQAEWLEAFYTLALGRPYLREVNYWDVSDEQAFVESAGLISALREKPAFQALRELCRRYRVGAFSRP